MFVSLDPYQCHVTSSSSGTKKNKAKECCSPFNEESSLILLQNYSTMIDSKSQILEKNNTTKSFDCVLSVGGLRIHVLFYF